eukprot:m.14523 g.14523  ORF g.14523 m.14523 type:complete len:511 (-) comp3160_c0_seq1:149-1681(-)
MASAPVAGRWASMYASKVMLAPMVRIGTLPSRLLALRYGADLVYTEELIDHKLVGCSRVENKLLSTVDFVMPNGKVVLRTCSEERDRVIFQMGTSDPDRAVAAARLVADDVAGIDVNMGCPKAFSLKGGMGAALLRTPDKAHAILSALVKSLPHKPITCKIRLLPTEAETLSLVKTLVSTGIAAIGVHGRLQTQRPREPVTPEQVNMIRRIANEVNIPVIANGGSLDIETFADIHTFRESAGCCSVMVARAAQWNLSVFRPEGPLPLPEVCCEYLRQAVRYDNTWENSKYCLMSMMKNEQLTPTGQALRQAASMRQLFDVWDIAHEYDEAVKTRAQRADDLGLPPPALGTPEEVEAELERARKRPRVERIDDRDVTVMDITYNPRMAVSVEGDNPKTQLINYCTKHQLPKPIYTARQEDKRWFAVCNAMDGRYASSASDPNKRRAEQSAALVCLTANGLVLNKDGTKKQDGGEMGAVAAVLPAASCVPAMPVAAVHPVVAVPATAAADGV